MLINLINNEIDITESVKFALDYILGQTSKSIDGTVNLKLKSEKGIEPQGYKRNCLDDTITIYASEEAGFMYGILDLEKEISHHNGIEGIADREVTPYIKKRGIKFNIPLDVRTPSYSDASDSAFHNIEHMWEFDFWTEFLDRMALNRYNVLSLWSLSPFPSIVKIPKYPEVALDDVKKSMRPAKGDLAGMGNYNKDMEADLVTVKKISMDEKIEFWKSVMEYAKSRCIDILLFTWNLFVYGTENTPYEITADQKNPITQDYIYHATKALLETYPLLAGIGVTSGENMYMNETDITFLADSYGKAVEDYINEHPERDFEFIQRTHYAQYGTIMEEFKDIPCSFSVSFKYSMAHMYSSTKPRFIDEFLKEKIKDQKFWLTIRNDDYYMYRIGDPDFAREYLEQLPVDEMHGYYMGADGYTWGRDYIDLRDDSHPLYVAKNWYMFSIWGLQSYNIDLPKDYFRMELDSYFKRETPLLYKTWAHASRIVPILNQVHWHNFDFQWYPEGCCMYDFEVDKLVFADVNEFTRCPSMPGSDYYSVSEYCKVLLNNDPIEKIDPISASKAMIEHAELALEGAKSLEEQDEENQEFIYTLGDIEALAYLGLYYADKIQAATALELYRKTGEKQHQNNSVDLLTKAAINWKKYSKKSKEMYRPQKLGRLCSFVDVERFDSLAELDTLLPLN